MNTYFGFDSQEDMMSNFAIGSEQLEGVEILYACYDGGGYEGSAHVIFRKDGKLYEVNASHCSCYGLEGQWEPEETSAVALLVRPNVAVEAKEILKQL